MLTRTELVRKLQTKGLRKFNQHSHQGLQHRLFAALFDFTQTFFSFFQVATVMLERTASASSRSRGFSLKVNGTDTVPGPLKISQRSCRDLDLMVDRDQIFPLFLKSETLLFLNENKFPSLVFKINNSLLYTL
jgi:hypothetical protein